MNALVKKISTIFGIDGAIFYTSSSQIISAIGGLVTVFLIAHFMTPATQGFYYTFASVLAIQTFFELGLGGIINQYTAHEMAYIKFSSSVHLEGEERYLSRLSSLMHFCFKWYAIAAGLLFTCLISVGFWYFNKFGHQYPDVNWQLPWILVTLGSSLNLFISPWMAVLQGMNKVKEMAKISLIKQLIILSVTWFSLIFGAQLYIISIHSLTGFAILLILYLNTSYPKLLINTYKHKIIETISYRYEIFPLQWKIAISWVSGYFVFQFFNPVVFAFNGAEAAGKLGMTLSVLNAITSFVVSWTSTKVPAWSVFIARKEFKYLDFSFKKTMQQSTFISIICIIIFVIFLLIINYLNSPLADRFLPIVLCIIIFVSIPFNNINNGWATYLRCHKKEPFLVQSIIVGTLTSISTLFGAKYIGVDAVIIGYSIIIIFVSFPIGLLLYKHYKKIYHKSVP
jgi:O-antigen/teichoic acid export membrane protein